MFHGVLPLHAGSSCSDLSPYLVRRLCDIIRRNGESDINGSSSGNDLEEEKVHYTSWITESWRVLSWSEPTSKLFWEIASLYVSRKNNNNNQRKHNKNGVGKDQQDEDVLITPTELPLSGLAIFLLLHVPSFSTTPKINPNPPSTFNEVWPTNDNSSAAASSSNIVSGGMSPRSPMNPRVDGHHSPRNDNFTMNATSPRYKNKTHIYVAICIKIPLSYI